MEEEEEEKGHLTFETIRIDPILVSLQTLLYTHDEDRCSLVLRPN